APPHLPVVLRPTGQRAAALLLLPLSSGLRRLPRSPPFPYTTLFRSHQLEVLDVVRDLNRERGTTVGIVLHDLNLAARCRRWCRRSEEHTSEHQSRFEHVHRLLLDTNNAP